MVVFLQQSMHKVLYFLLKGVPITGKGKTRKRKNGNGIAEKRVKGEKAEKG